MSSVSPSPIPFRRLASSSISTPDSCLHVGAQPRNFVVAVLRQRALTVSIAETRFDGLVEDSNERRLVETPAQVCLALCSD